jgi:putative ABC transport system substrate-binding protein
MKKKVIVLTLCTMLFALCLSVEAQQMTKVYRIGYLSGTDRTTDSPRAEAIRAALRELRYIEGQNIVIEYRHAGGGRGRQPELAAELVSLKVDLIVVAGGDPLIRAAMNATNTIPLVLGGSGSDPVKADFL